MTGTISEAIKAIALFSIIAFCVHSCNQMTVERYKYQQAKCND